MICKVNQTKCTRRKIKWQSPLVLFDCFFLPVKLTAVNDKMAEYTNTPGTASLNAALMHTLQRHRDILQVCSFMFYTSHLSSECSPI